MVGAVCCRVEQCDNSSRLYIVTLGCLPNYRRLGIGSAMLQHVLNFATTEAAGSFDAIYLHVHVDNHEAIDFYRKFQFEIAETKPNYYRRMAKPDAYILIKNLKKQIHPNENAVSGDCNSERR